MMLCAGWTLDEVLDLTWDQLQACVYCMVSYKMEQINMVSEMATAMLGGKVKKKGKHGAKRELTQKEKANKEQALLQGISAMGFPITSS